MSILSTEFLLKYPNDNIELSQEARDQIKEMGYDTWKECVADAVCINMIEAYKQFKSNGLEVKMFEEKMSQEAEMLFDNIFNLKQFLPKSLHTDAKITPDDVMVDVKDLLHIAKIKELMIFCNTLTVRCDTESLKKFKEVHKNFKISHVKDFIVGDVIIVINKSTKNTFYPITKLLLEVLDGKSKEIVFFYENDITDVERYQYECMVNELVKVIKGTNTSEKEKRRLTMKDMFDMMCIMSNGEKQVTFITDDVGIVAEKYKTKNVALNANVNVIVELEEEPTKEQLVDLIKMSHTHGEFGILNRSALRKKRPNACGISADGATILADNGTCSTTYVNVLKFIKEKDGVPILNFSELMTAQVLSARAGLRETLRKYHITRIDNVTKRDRLIACSLLNWKKAMEKLKYDKRQEESLIWELSASITQELVEYAHGLRIPTPLLTTTLKPVIRTDNDEVIFPNNLLGVTREEVLAPIKDQFQDYLIKMIYCTHNATTTFYVNVEEQEELATYMLQSWGMFVSANIKYTQEVVK